MSKEGNHHYVPQFHLRMWKGTDGKITQWGRIPFNNTLVCKPVTTAATAYVPSLYSLQHVIPEHEQQIETEVFGKIETETKPILEKMIRQGVGSLSVNDRYWWTVYLNASIARVPHVIEKIKTGANELISEKLGRDLDDYNALKGDAPEQNLFEWAKNHAPAELANSGLRVLVNLIGDKRVIDRMGSLTWLVRDVSAASRRLMIGDDPFERINDLFKPRTLISIPLSPTHVFFGTDAPDVVSRIEGMSALEIVKMSNISSLSTAKKFAYGQAERAFVEKYFPHIK